MDKIFEPGPRSYQLLLDRLDRQLGSKYRDHTTAQNFTLKPLPPKSEEYEQNALFETARPVEPPQTETLFPPAISA